MKMESDMLLKGSNSGTPGGIYAFLASKRNAEDGAVLLLRIQIPIGSWACSSHGCSSHVFCIRV